jgi:hypothetical protein
MLHTGMSVSKETAVLSETLFDIALESLNGDGRTMERTEEESLDLPIPPNTQGSLIVEIRYLRRDLAALGNRIDGKLTDHESRIRKIEERMWWLAGAFAAMQFLSHYLPGPHQ